jgi:hypothetical protein
VHVSSTYVEELKGMSLLVRAESDGKAIGTVAEGQRLSRAGPEVWATLGTALWS